MGLHQWWFWEFLKRRLDQGGPTAGASSSPPTFLQTTPAPPIPSQTSRWEGLEMKGLITSSAGSIH